MYVVPFSCDFSLHRIVWQVIFACSSNHIFTCQFKKFYCIANIVMWKLKARKKWGTRVLQFVQVYYYAWIHTSKDLAFYWLSFLGGHVLTAWLIFSILFALLNDRYLKSIAKVMYLRTFWIETKMWLCPRNAEYCLWVKAQAEESTDITAGRVFPLLVLKAGLARHNSGTLVRKRDCRLLISVSSRRTQSLRKICPRT